MVDRVQEIEIDKPTGAHKRQEVLVIDISIGHSHLDKGAKGMYHVRELREYDFNSKVRVALEEYARQQKDLAIKFRFWDHRDHPEWGMRKGKQKGSGYILYDRLVAMYQKEVDPPVRIALDLHNNASKNPTVNGSMFLYRYEAKEQIEDQQSKKLAEQLELSFKNNFPQMKNRGVMPDMKGWVNRDLAFLKWGFRYAAASVIIEFGFITSPVDQEFMLDATVPKKYVDAIMKGIYSFIKK